MLPDPLHPAIVHLPIALTLLLPIFTFGALVAVRRGARLRIAWGLVVLVALALAVSARVAVFTGAQQEERVERIVPELALETHEERAETFALASLVVAAVAGLGLLESRAGGVARALMVAGALALLAGAVAVGQSGGELVYRHGAALAYAGAPVPGGDVGSSSDPGGRSGEVEGREADEDGRARPRLGSR